jgi:hypothetical protein
LCAQSKQEAAVLEVEYLKNDVNATLAHLDEWTRPEKVLFCFAIVGSQETAVGDFIPGGRNLYDH